MSGPSFAWNSEIRDSLTRLYHELSLQICNVRWTNYFHVVYTYELFHAVGKAVKTWHRSLPCAEMQYQLYMVIKIKWVHTLLSMQANFITMQANFITKIKGQSAAYSIHHGPRLLFHVSPDSWTQIQHMWGRGQTNPPHGSVVLV